ncbi:MAG: T9SS type A sorting domain-containing protein [Candidatus Eisenbacteria bacterium]
MTARLFAALACTVLLAAVPASAATNFWPRTAATSTHLGFGVTNMATSMDAVADGSGGFFVVYDNGYDSHVQHVLANGSTAWLWYQFQLPGSTNGFGNPSIALDGQGGVFVAYETHGGFDELRMLRLTSAGTVDPDWPAAGLPVCPSSDYDFLADVCEDGYGGAFVTFVRNADYRVYVQHVLGTGKLDWYWPENGVCMQEAGQYVMGPRVLPDGEGGAMVFYAGTPRGGSEMLVARVDRYGNRRTDLFPDSGLPLGPATYASFDAVRTRDGLFGVAWSNSSSGNSDIYLDVLDNNGRTGFAPAGGLRLSPGPEHDEWPALATNVYCDFLVTWVSGNRIMGARRQQDLSTHPAFPSGLAVLSSSLSGFVHHPSIASDGGEGMVVGWRDPSEYSVLRAQHLRNDGTIAAGWGAGGQVMATSTGYIGDYQRIFSDGDGGASAVFSDYGAMAINRVRRDGSHGLLVPAVFTLLTDVAMDQGGKLSVYWRASEVDTTPANPVGSYLLWRRMPDWGALAKLARGARALADGESPEGAGEGAIRAVADGVTTIYWEYLGSTPARGWAGYGKTVNTLSDLYGPAYAVPYEVFMLETVSPAGAVLATSAPDSGFSVDNLSPAMPSAFTAARSGGMTHLAWAPTAEPDFASYRLHRGTSAAFVPSEANLVATPVSTGWDDAGAAGYFYKLAAVDVHGNTGNYAIVSPSQTLDAPGATAEFALTPPANPALGGRVSVRFALAAGAPARLELLDVSGRRVSAHTLAGAGPHAIELGAEARLRSGVYFVRLSQGARVATARVMVVQ